MFVQGKEMGQTPRGQQARSDGFWAVGESQASKTKKGRTLKKNNKATLRHLVLKQNPRTSKSPYYNTGC